MPSFLTLCCADAFFLTDFGETSGLAALLPDISPPPAWLGVEYDSVGRYEYTPELLGGTAA